MAEKGRVFLGSGGSGAPPTPRRILPSPCSGHWRARRGACRGGGGGGGCTRTHGTPVADRILDLLAEADRRGKPVALCTVIRAQGSVPRHEGSKMLVFADGSIEGSIGGGGEGMSP